jgi:hypothetical protein
MPHISVVAPACNKYLRKRAIFFEAALRGARKPHDPSLLGGEMARAWLLANERLWRKQAALLQLATGIGECPLSSREALVGRSGVSS